MIELVFDNLISADELFANVLRRFATYLLVNNNSCRKVVSSLELPIIFDDNLKTILVSFFIAYFHLLTCEFDSSTFKHCIESFYMDKNSIILKHLIYFYSSL